MKRVGVLVHPTRPVLDAVEVLEQWSGEHGVELVQVPRGKQPEVAPPGEVGRDDLIVALGGDGTILKALHASAATQTPVLGVAYGSLGALTTVPTAELRTGLDRFIAGDWRPSHLPALSVRAGDSEIGAGINDVVLARGRGTQLALDVWIEDELYVRMAGDGLVLATPLGSSAYSMAAGGALLPAGSRAFVCTPVSMHGGCAAPVVLAGDGEVRLRMHPGHTGFYVDVDGFPVETEAEEFAVTMRDGYATLVAFDDSRTGFPRLRARGLISDSPRVLGRERRSPELENTTEASPA